MFESCKNNFILYLEREKYYSKNTVRAYLTDIEDFKKFLCKKNIEWNSLHTKDVSEWLISLKKLSSRSVARKLSSLKSFYDYLLNTKIIEKNTFKIFSAPKSQNNIPTTLNPNDIIKIIENMPESDILERRNKAVVVLMYATGIRAEELCTLRVSSLSANGIKVLGKGNKERIVPLIEAVKKHLKLWLDDRDKLYKSEDYLFLSNNGRKLTYSMIFKIVQKISGENYFHPHAFRYSFASHLLDNQTNIRYIQELLGHSNLSVTQRYTKMSISSLKQKFNQFHPRAK